MTLCHICNISMCETLAVKHTLRYNLRCVFTDVEFSLKSKHQCASHWKPPMFTRYALMFFEVKFSLIGGAVTLGFLSHSRLELFN